MTDKYMRCKAIFQSGLEALAETTAAQTLVAEAVRRRDWVDFDASIEAMKALSGKVEKLENERLALFQSADGVSGGDKDIYFYNFVQHFPEEQRQVLCGLYRQIKLEAARARFSADALVSYLGEARALVSGLIEAAFPEKRGRIYGKSGMERGKELGGIVLDRRF
jgi:hypothetical protein